jgi:hypothetical protein
VAVTGVLPLAEAILLKLPVQVQGMLEVKVQRAAGEQADKEPTFHVRLLPDRVCVPVPPTQVTVPAQAGKLSVTTGDSLPMDEITIFLKAVWP